MSQEFFAYKVPEGCLSQMEAVHASGREVVSVAFAPEVPGWVVIPSSGPATGGSLSADFQQALTSSQSGGADVRCVAFTPQYGWFMTNSDGALSQHGLPSGFAQTLTAADGPAAVTCVAFTAQGGWVVVNQKGQCFTSSNGVPSGLLNAVPKLTAGVRWVAFTPGSGWVVIGNNGAWYGGDGVAPQAWMYLSYYSSLLGPLTFAAFTPFDGWTVAAAATNNRVLLPIENPQGTLDPLTAFESLQSRLNTTTVGWAAMIGSPQNATSFAHGYARTAANAPAQPFLPSTKWQTASTSKVLTALTTIVLVDKLPNQRGNALNIQIGNYLPQGWTVATGVPEITFGQLLSHTSGIPDYGGGRTYDQLRQYFQTVKLNPNPGMLYTNISYGLLRLLIPALAGFNYPVNASPDPNELFSTKYVELVNQYVFAPVGVTGMACEPPAGSDTYALAYKYPGSSPGYDWSEQDGQPLYLLSGPGGWWVSLDDMQQVMTSLSQVDGRILTQAQWYQMLNIVNDAVTPYPNGWDQIEGTVPPYWIMKDGGVSTPDPPSNMTTVFAIYGTKTWGVAVANSDICGPNTERGWAGCNQCGCMWCTSVGGGACPGGSGGGHNSTNEWDYLLPVNIGPPWSQPHWRRCPSCESLWYAGSNEAGRCAGTGAGHLQAGDCYINTVRAGTSYPTDQDTGWRRCSKCLVLYDPGWAGTPHCAAGGTHARAGSDAYWVQSVPIIATLLNTAFTAGTST